MEERNIYYNGRVKIPDEITEIKDKVVMGLTGRQLLCSVIAAVCAGVSMFLLYSLTPIRGSGWLMLSMVFAAPALAFGFVTPAGLPLEDWLTIWWSNNMKSAPIRKLVADNAYEKALAAVKNHESQEAGGKNGKKGKKGRKKAAKKKGRVKSAYVLRK